MGYGANFQKQFKDSGNTKALSFTLARNRTVWSDRSCTYFFMSWAVVQTYADVQAQIEVVILPADYDA